MSSRAGQFGAVGAINVVRTLIGNGLAVGLATAGYSYYSIAWGTLAGVACSTVLVNVIGWRAASLRVGVAQWRRVTKFGVQMLGLGVVWTITGKLTDVILGRLLGLAALGLYSRATGLNGLLWDSLHLIISRVVFVDFAEQKRRGLSLRNSYLRIVAVLTGALWPAFLGLAIVSGPVVLTIYGEVWVGAALPLSLLSISCAILVAITMTSEVFLVSQELPLQVRFEVKRDRDRDGAVHGWRVLQPWLGRGRAARGRGGGVHPGQAASGAADRYGAGRLPGDLWPQRAAYAPRMHPGGPRHGRTWLVPRGPAAGRAAGDRIGDAGMGRGPVRAAPPAVGGDDDALSPGGAPGRNGMRPDGESGVRSISPRGATRP